MNFWTHVEIHKEDQTKFHRLMFITGLEYKKVHSYRLPISNAVYRTKYIIEFEYKDRLKIKTIKEKFDEVYRAKT